MLPPVTARVAVTDVATPVPRQVLKALAALDIDRQPWSGDVECPAEVLVAGPATEVTAALVQLLPELRLVIRTGAGFENVELATLQDRGVGLLVPRVADDRSVAEYTFAAMLFLLRGLRQADAAVRTGGFGYRERFLGRSLDGLALGVVGFGRIGAQVATLGRAFSMRVQVWNPWSEKRLPDHVTRASSLDALLDTADVVTIHCRLTEETSGLFGAATLAKMRQGALLINTARGAIVDEAALAEALAAGRLAGAAVDCFAEESDGMTSPLHRVSAALLSPHLAGLTEQSVTRIADFVAGNVVAFLTRGEVRDSDQLIPTAVVQ